MSSSAVIMPNLPQDAVVPPKARRLLFAALLTLIGIGLLMAFFELPWWGAALAPMVVFLPLAFLFPEIGWWCMLIATPFSLEVILPTTTTAMQFPTEPIILCTLLFWIPQRIARFPLRLPLTALDAAVSALFLAAIFSMTVSSIWLESVKGVLNFGWYLAIGYLMTVVTITSKTQIRNVMMVMIGLAVIFSIFGIILYIQNLGAVVQADFGRQVPEPFFQEHGTYAAYLMYGLCFATAFGVRPSQSPARWTALVLAIVIIIALIFSGTRAAWVSLAAPVAIIGGYHIIRRFHPLKLLAVLAILGLVVYGLYEYVISGIVSGHFMSIGNVESNLSNLERLNRWAAAWNMWLDAPITGHGWAMYQHEYQSFRVMELQTPMSWYNMGAHQEFLTILAETGLIGFLPFMVIFLLCWRNSRAIRRITTDVFFVDASLGLSSAIFAYALHGLFNSYLMFDKIAVPFWVSIGLLAVIHRLAVGEHTHGT
jgi:putative inorganic carbon (hco3(-)) transporter